MSLQSEAIVAGALSSLIDSIAAHSQHQNAEPVSWSDLIIMAAHADKGAHSLLEIRRRVQQSFFTETPITAILEVTFRIEFQADTNVATKHRIRNELRPRLRADLVRELALGARLGNHQITIQFDETTATSKHFSTKSGYPDVLKADMMKEIIRRVNIQWQGLRENDGVTRASVNFLLSRPLDYYNPRDEEPLSSLTIQE